MKALKKAQRAKGLPCWICGQPINYQAEDPNADDAFSFDHYWPWQTHPGLREDPGNARSAHQKCNKQRGETMLLEPDLGDLVEQW